MRAGRPLTFSNPRHDEHTMMAWVLSGKSGSGSPHPGKGLAGVSKVPLAQAGRRVDYTDPVTRHVRTTPAYRVYNQYVKKLNLPSSVASSPASLGNLTGKKVVMHMHRACRLRAQPDRQAATRRQRTNPRRKDQRQSRRADRHERGNTSYNIHNGSGKARA